MRLGLRSRMASATTMYANPVSRKNDVTRENRARPGEADGSGTACSVTSRVSAPPRSSVNLTLSPMRAG